MTSSHNNNQNDYYNAKIDATEKDLEKAKEKVLKTQSTKADFKRQKAESNRLRKFRESIRKIFEQYN